MAKKFEVKMLEQEGSCNTELFNKMVSRGDLSPLRISEAIDNTVTIKGLAKATINSDDREFDLFYIDTEELGLISSSSQVFEESIKSYYPDDCKTFLIKKIKTKKGFTYKATPAL